MKSLNEDVTTEYKEDIPKKGAGFKAEIVSFLNTEPGGIIYLGVSDDGSKISCKNKNKEFQRRQEWENTICNWINDGFVPNVNGLIEVRNMIFRSSRKPFDLEESIIQDLYFTNLMNKLSEKDLEFDLKSLRLKDSKSSYYNNAAYVFSEQNQSVTKLAVYNGLSTINFKDKQNFIGSIIRQIDDILSYSRLVNTNPAIITGEAKRQGRASYPEEAIREAVINAFAHRDYSLPADIRIEFFDDRLEIHSPGPIFGGLSIEDIMDGSNARRNPTIVHVLDKIDYMENFGSGIRRIYSLYSNFKKKPKITATENSFKITLYNRNYLLNKGKINEDMLLIIEYLSSVQSAPRKEIQEQINLTKGKTIDLLNELILENIVIKKGESVSTVYLLKG